MEWQTLFFFSPHPVKLLIEKEVTREIQRGAFGPQLEVQRLGRAYIIINTRIVTDTRSRQLILVVKGHQSHYNIQVCSLKHISLPM